MTPVAGGAATHWQAYGPASALLHSQHSAQTSPFGSQHGAQIPPRSVQRTAHRPHRNVLAAQRGAPQRHTPARFETAKLETSLFEKRRLHGPWVRADVFAEGSPGAPLGSVNLAAARTVAQLRRLLLVELGAPALPQPGYVFVLEPEMVVNDAQERSWPATALGVRVCLRPSSEPAHATEPPFHSLEVRLDNEAVVLEKSSSARARRSARSVLSSRRSCATLCLRAAPLSTGVAGWSRLTAKPRSPPRMLSATPSCCTARWHCDYRRHPCRRRRHYRQHRRHQLHNGHRKHPR